MTTPVYSVYVPHDDESFKNKKVRRIPGRYYQELSKCIEQASCLAKDENLPAYVIEYGLLPTVLMSIMPDGELKQLSCDCVSHKMES